mmetsp:Transcript_67829/g.102296  ORF Transcript_67829/g.102296 Transcript_67829/m.102296 type:complete len:304 (-) Transcript_67829:224-1135(-)
MKVLMCHNPQSDNFGVTMAPKDARNGIPTELNPRSFRRPWILPPIAHGVAPNTIADGSAGVLTIHTAIGRIVPGMHKQDGINLQIPVRIELFPRKSRFLHLIQDVIERLSQFWLRIRLVVPVTAIGVVLFRPIRHLPILHVCGNLQIPITVLTDVISYGPGRIQRRVGTFGIPEQVDVFGRNQCAGIGIVVLPLNQYDQRVEFVGGLSNVSRVKGASLQGVVHRFAFVVFDVATNVFGQEFGLVVVWQVQAPAIVADGFQGGGRFESIVVFSLIVNVVVVFIMIKVTWNSSFTCSCCLGSYGR